MVVIELVGLMICGCCGCIEFPEYSDIDMSGKHHMYNMVQMSWETWLLSFYLIGWMATGCKNSHTREDLTSCGRIMPGWYVTSWDHQPSEAGECEDSPPVMWHLTLSVLTASQSPHREHSDLLNTQCCIESPPATSYMMWSASPLCITVILAISI